MSKVEKKLKLIASWFFLTLLLFTVLVAPPSVMALEQGHWWETVPEEEKTSPYYDSIPYWQIAPTLREIEVKSNRVRVEVIGQSAGGRNLFLVTVSAPEAFGRLGR